MMRCAQALLGSFYNSENRSSPKYTVLTVLYSVYFLYNLAYMGRTVDALAEDKIFVLKSSGERLGPYKAAVDSQKNIVEVFTKELDAEAGDKLLRPTAPNREEIYEIIDVHYESLTHGVFANFQLDVKRQGAPEKPVRGSVSNTYNISGYQNIQIGDHNVQSIMNMLQSLITEIDKADATPEQKVDAKNRLQAFLAHPLVTSIMGGAAGSLAGDLTSRT